MHYQLRRTKYGTWKVYSCDHTGKNKRLICATVCHAKATKLMIALREAND